MNEAFSLYFSISLQGALLTAVILLMRLPLGHSPARYRHALWLVLLVRLLIPAELPSPASLYNALPPAIMQSGERLAALTAPAEGIPQDKTALQRPEEGAVGGSALAPDGNAPSVQGEATPEIIPVTGDAAEPAIYLVPHIGEPSGDADTVTSGGVPRRLSIPALVWLIGCGAVFAYMSAVYAAAWFRARHSLEEGNTAVSRDFKRPFVIGFFRPIIALPHGLSPDTRAYVAAHERAHIRRLDHITHLLMACALCLNWFNPAVWLAAHFMDMDCEAACDERVTRGMDAETRKRYAQALVDVAATKPNRLPAPVLAFSGGGLKQRVKRVLGRRKYTLPGVLAALAALIVLAVIGLTSALPQGEAAMGGASPTPTQTQSTVAGGDHGAADTPAPAATPEPVLPLNAESSFAPLTWEGEVPKIKMPTLALLSYKASPMEYDADAIGARMWGARGFTREDSEYGITLTEGQPLHEEYSETVYINFPDDTQPYAYDVNPYGKIGYGLVTNGEYAVTQEEYEIPYEQAVSDTKVLIEKLLGGSGYDVQPVAGYTDINDYWATAYWQQRVNGFYAYGLGISLNYYSYGVNHFDANIAVFTPIGNEPAARPLTFEEALYALNHAYLSQDAPDAPARLVASDYSYIFENTRAIKAVNIAYTDIFDRVNHVFSPAWSFEVYAEDADNLLGTIFVDMATGDIAHSGTYRPSPYTARGHTPSATDYLTHRDALYAELDALFPFTFAQKDGYTYYIEPFDQSGRMPNRMSAEIWRRSDTTGQEELLSDRMAFSNAESVLNARGSMFAAVVGERIVFRGYEEDRDMKSGGKFISIATDGGDMRTLDVKYDSMSYVCVDGERIYYVGWPGNDRDAWPLNYVDPMLDKHRNVITSDKIPFAVKDGMAYAIGDPNYVHFDRDKLVYKDGVMYTPEGEVYVSPGSNGLGEMIYRMEKNTWVEHQAVPFNAQTITRFLEDGSWLMVGEEGREYVFAP